MLALRTEDTNPPCRGFPHRSARQLRPPPTTPWTDPKSPDGRVPRRGAVRSAPSLCAALPHCANDSPGEPATTITSDPQPFRAAGLTSIPSTVQQRLKNGSDGPRRLADGGDAARGAADAGGRGHLVAYQTAVPFTPSPVRPSATATPGKSSDTVQQSWVEAGTTRASLNRRPESTTVPGTAGSGQPARLGGSGGCWCTGALYSDITTWLDVAPQRPVIADNCHWADVCRVNSGLWRRGHALAGFSVSNDDPFCRNRESVTRIPGAARGDRAHMWTPVHSVFTVSASIQDLLCRRPLAACCYRS